MRGAFADGESPGIHDTEREAREDEVMSETSKCIDGGKCHLQAWGNANERTVPVCKGDCGIARVRHSPVWGEIQRADDQGTMACRDVIRRAAS